MLTSQIPESSSAGVPLALSPSRVADFKSCPLLYRFRAIDRLPEPPSAEAVRGTLVHTVLERLFDAPPAERTPEHAHRLAGAGWAEMLTTDPELGALVGESDEATRQWLADTALLLDRYFELENPQLLEPAARELLLEVPLDDDTVVKGIIDRVDVAPGGQIRIVDYKSGRAPSPLFEQRALFQMRVYALLMWRQRGHLPDLLQLIYLSDSQIVRLEPDADDLQALEKTLRALAVAISRARETGDFRASPSRLCDWCGHRARCPAWGGTPPPYPGLRVAAESTT